MKRNLKKFIGLLLTFAFMSTSLGVDINNNEWKKKIDPELWEVMAEKTNKDLIPVYLWLKEVDDEIIEAALIQEKGMDSSVYMDQERFNAEIVSEIEAEIVAEVGREAANYKEIPAEIKENQAETSKISAPPKISNLSKYAFENEDLKEFDWNISLVDRAVSMKVDEYIMARREITKREYSAVNDNFITKNIGKKQRDVIYNSRYTSTIVVEATKSEIESYAKKDIVEEISFYVELIMESELNRVLNQIGADSSIGTKSASYNSGSGYKGTGVKIGIIEAEGGAFDSSAPQLNGVSNLTFLNNAGILGASVTSSVNDHATMVTSIIKGNLAYVSGVGYEGIVPSATVYQTPINNAADVQRAIQKLADKGVSVINFSGGKETGTGYDSHDKEVDKLINNTKVTFVVAAGNNGSGNGNVLSPGKALNAITVGNVETKSSSTSTNSSPYSIRATSSFNHVSYIPNKPDVVAPGTNISFVRSTGSTMTNSGTSFSAPIVTGIVAQMIQSSSDFKLRPELVKAKLILSSKYSQVRTTSSNPADNTNTFIGSKLWKKTGAGFVNAMGAVGSCSWRILKMSDFKNTSQYTNSISLSSGQTIRIVMTFNRSSNSSISSNIDYDDMDIELVNPSGSVVASSVQGSENVEIIEYKATSSGTYTLRIKKYRIKGANSDALVTTMWRLI